ncbi:zeta-sarcoglycan [Platysternon megacephalum]|uniref:Zeta-sarcoglycan n=1 Tax=Platysternon megacephalum TaxID=55544 RepID=A0A4D9EWQ2_9SAUR|nr:zeta-sarcoglycan [Platysternon megacephalum]
MGLLRVHGNWVITNIRDGNRFKEEQEKGGSGGEGECARKLLFQYSDSLLFIRLQSRPGASEPLCVDSCSRTEGQLSRKIFPSVSFIICDLELALGKYGNSLWKAEAISFSLSISHFINKRNPNFWGR